MDRPDHGQAKEPSRSGAGQRAAAVWAHLKPLGYKKRGRTFNRLMQGGNTLVVNFQQGLYAKSKYGHLTVNLGVFLPCVFLLERGEELPLFCLESDCHVRERLGCLVHDGTDVWLDLSPDPATLADTLIGELTSVGLPFLDGFASPAKVAEHFEEHESLPGCTSSRGKVVAAIVNYELGKPEVAQALLRSAYETTRPHPFNTQIRWFAEKLDLPFDL